MTPDMESASSDWSVGASARRRGAATLRFVALIAGIATLFGMIAVRIDTAQRLTSAAHLTRSATATQIAPDFTLQTWAWWDQQAPQTQPASAAIQAAETIRLAALHGRPVVVNFGASWCDACRAEAPTFETAWRQYRTQGVVFLGIDVEDTEHDSQAFLRRYGITYFNGPDVTETIRVAYGVSSLPTTVFIDRKGHITGADIGELDAATLNAAVQALLR